jgi:predicted glycoside hydrolase/deacetylase ChbG (UPF0249 family)
VSRELIINVDDIGIYSGAVAAAIVTISDGVAASGSVMAVCPGTAAALEFLRDRPEVPVGVHLTLTADFPETPWHALTAGASISEDGRLLGIDQRERLLAQAEAGEVQVEFRAQIEKVLAAGVQPTHLDWHCLADGGREDIFELTLALAQEYGTGIRAWTDESRSALRSRGLPAQDQPFLDSFALPLVLKEAVFLDRIRRLPDGLSEWAMHPAEPDPDDPGGQVRLTDHELLLAASTRQVLHEEDILVRGYGDPRLRTSTGPAL